MKAAACQDDWMGRPSTVFGAMIIALIVVGIVVGLDYDKSPYQPSTCISR
jgi:hypothetical protein